MIDKNISATAFMNLSQLFIMYHIDIHICMHILEINNKQIILINKFGYEQPAHPIPFYTSHVVKTFQCITDKKRILVFIF